MNIAHIIPHSVSFPLSTPNGRYEWVRQLALLQKEQGHSVTIYGNPDSTVEGLVSAGISNPTGNKHDNNVATFRLAFANDHDIFHSHFDNLHYEVAHETSKPVVYTQHWWPKDKTIELAKSIMPNNVWAVPPTQYMQTFDIKSGIKTRGFIYHGINLEAFHPTSAVKNARLLFVGRISPEKNLPIAIAVAKKAGVGLDIVGRVAPKNETYWQEFQHLVDGEQIKYLGTKNQKELVDLYSVALGVICPFEPTEAFGLVAVEAQACGAPIIMKRGSSRGELLEEGTTGFLCETEEEFIEAIHRLVEINPQDCIAFAQAFDIRLMADAYEKLYRDLLQG